LIFEANSLHKVDAVAKVLACASFIA